MSSSENKILIVDDDPFIAEMYAIKFKESGFEVEIATDGKVGIEKVKELNPGIVLLDVVMPVMDGFDVLKELGKEKLLEKTRVILLTNLGEKQDVERGMSLGATDYVIKAHFTPTEVVNKVKNVLEKHG